MKYEYEYILAICFFLALCHTSCKSYFEIVKVEDDIEFYQEQGIPIKPGKCFAKSRIENEYSYTDEIVRVYTGDKYIRDALKHREYLASPEKSKWVSTTNKRAEYRFTEHGFDYYRVKEEANIGEFFEVIDTSLTKEFQYEKIRVYKLEKEVHNAWVEVICEEDMTKDLIKKLQKALRENGFEKEVEVNGKMDGKTYYALGFYQYNNNLPSGNLNLESLRKLGIYQ